MVRRAGVLHGSLFRAFVTHFDCSPQVNVLSRFLGSQGEDRTFTVHEPRTDSNMSTSPLALRPHDVCVLLQLAITPGITFRELADRAGQSVGEAHNATKRLEVARLCSPGGRAVNRSAMLDFLIMGVPYTFPGELGAETRGVPTAHSGPAMRDEFDSPHVVVWPSVDGETRGLSLAPLCSAAPKLPGSNPDLYRLLSVVDALRVGRARERRVASDILKREFSGAGE